MGYRGMSVVRDLVDQQLSGGVKILSKIHHAFQCDHEKTWPNQSFAYGHCKASFHNNFKVMYACLYTSVYIVENKQRPYVMSIVIAYKRFAVRLGDQ